MQWSKLRSAVRALVCPELRKRIDFHITSYRHSHDEAEKAWITVDGDNVFTASWYQHQWHGWPRDAKGRLDFGGTSPVKTNPPKSGTYLPQELGDALRTYINMPIEAPLESANPFIRALIIVDRRIGKRTIESMKITKDDHPLVKEFYRLRVDATVQD